MKGSHINQDCLQRGLRPRRARNMVSSKFKGTEAANKSDINATIDDLKHYYTHMCMTIHTWCQKLDDQQSRNNNIEIIPCVKRIEAFW